MTPDQSESTFRARLTKPLEQLTVPDGLDAMFVFYAEQRAERVNVAEHGDMLLYQWGVYSFSEAETFQVNITRQFLVMREDEPYQLMLTFHFPPHDEMRKIEPGTRWCRSPQELPEFRTFVKSSEAFRTVATAEPRRIELSFEEC